MMEPFPIPEQYQEAFRRLSPHMAPPLRSQAQILQSVLIYLKLGGERLGRIAIDAFNETQRLNDAQTQKRLREEVLLRENQEMIDEEETEEVEVEKAAEDEPVQEFSDEDEEPEEDLPDL